MSSLTSSNKNSELNQNIKEIKSLGYQALAIEADISNSLQVKVVKKLLVKF